jgi:hypothetical protein
MPPTPRLDRLSRPSNLSSDGSETAAVGARFSAPEHDRRRPCSQRDDGRIENEIPVGILLSEVEPEPITWLWPNRIARGKVTLLDGDPGLGKSALTIDFAARVSRGQPWPDGAPCPEGGVVILTAEDGLADTVRPRLDAAGGDPGKVVVLEVAGDDKHPVSIPGDVDELERAIERVGAVLVIVDPLMAFLDSATNSRMNHDIRRALRPVASLAERTGVAVVVIRHLNKSPGAPAIYRGGGSIGIIGAARIALLVGRDPEDEERLVLAAIKTNIGPKPAALAYRLTPGSNGAVSVKSEGESDLTADQLVAVTSEEDRGALKEAVDWLRHRLTDGPIEAKRLKDEARRAGIAEKTLWRAAKLLGVKTNDRAGFGPGFPSRWSLPLLGHQTAYSANPPSWPTRGEAGPVGAPMLPAHDPLKEPVKQLGLRIDGSGDAEHLPLAVRLDERKVGPCDHCRQVPQNGYLTRCGPHWYCSLCAQGASNGARR